MKDELFSFQRKAVNNLLLQAKLAHNEYSNSGNPQVISFTAPTGSGKTIIMAALVESILFGTEKSDEAQDSIFVWLSDSPQLNEQSKNKFDSKADKIRLDQCVIIEDEKFDQEFLDDGHIYFLNTQKISKAGNLTIHSDKRQFTIWETIENTARQKSDKLYFIIDEAHRGMQGREAGKATSIMQKFLKGSEKDQLSPIPVVIGMSATSKRFETLIEGTTNSTIRKTVITADEVRASGLLKDRIVLTYPKNKDVNGDMAILQAATDEWKNKCAHWHQYTYEQHYANVNPVFVIQVENGNSEIVSKTNLDDVINKIEERIDYKFKEGEVVHTFGQTGLINVGGLVINHIDPVDIADNRRVRVVLFKDNLSTGWDCPRAETMMSFKHAEDATYIAQLLGRMIRTPLQMRVLVDESLNDVHLYLPYFNELTVKQIVDEIQNSEGGDIPTVIDDESFEMPTYTTWTSKPKRTNKPNEPAKGQVSLFGNDVQAEELYGGQFNESNNDLNNNISYANSFYDHELEKQKTKNCVNDNQIEYECDNESQQKVKQLPLTGIVINREEVVDHINKIGLLTYEIKDVTICSYLESMLKLARLVSQTGIDQTAYSKIKVDMVEMIRNHIEELEKRNKYKEYSEKILEFQLSSSIFDAFGEEIKDFYNYDIFTSSDSDLDRQLRNADAKLGSIGIANEYGRKYNTEDNPNKHKIDTILFAADEDSMKMLGEYSENKFHSMNDEYRKYIIGKSEKYQKMYRDIVADGDKISKHNYSIPEFVQARMDDEGKEYDDHLFINEEKGYAKIKLNTWEEGVLSEERRRNDFVTWIRNPSRGTWSLRIPYEIDNTTKPMYPDFLIIRADPNLNYVIDILEPHGSQYKDNINKAKGLAKYAEDNPSVGRVQLIRMSNDSIGNNKFKRLDLSKGSIRKKVLEAINNDELDHLFDLEGFFDC